MSVGVIIFERQPSMHLEDWLFESRKRRDTIERLPWPFRRSDVDVALCKKIQEEKRERRGVFIPA
jgi:hypothetical protein